MPKSFTVNDMFSMIEGNEFAACPKCYNEFYRPDRIIEKNHPGFLCPECRKKGFGLVGVVHFTPDCEINIIPTEVTTA